MTTIIGLAGYAQSGKDTVAETLVRERGYVRVAFADALREGVYTLNPWVFLEANNVRLQWLVDAVGWDEAKKDPEVRRLLQVFGTEVGRNLLGQNIWVEAAMRKAAEHEKVVFTDVRFPNEVQAISNAAGHLYRVVRPGIDAVNRHVSETAIDDYLFPIIKNNGTLDELADEARMLDI